MTLPDRVKCTRLFIFCVVLCNVLIFSTSIHAAKLNKKTLVENLWKARGGTQTMIDIKDGIVNDNVEVYETLDPGVKTRVIEILSKHLDEMEAIMLDYMMEKADVSKLRPFHDWMQTPLGQKITKLEASSKQNINSLSPGVSSRSGKKMDKERSKLFARYEKLAFYTMNELTSNTMAFYLTITNQLEKPRNRMNEKQLEQNIKLLEVKVTNITSQILPVIFTTTYEKLDNNELTAFINNLDSESAKYYDKLFLEAYAHAINLQKAAILLDLAKVFDDKLAILSPHSKVKISDAKQKELMQEIIRRHGKGMVIRTMLDARAGKMTIKMKGEIQQVYGRPNKDLVTIDTLMIDLDYSGIDIRKFYQMLRNKLH